MSSLQVPGEHSLWFVCLARRLAHYALGGYMGWAAVTWAYFLSPAPCPHSGPTIQLLHPQDEWGHQEGPVVTSPNPSDSTFAACNLIVQCFESLKVFGI